jgi:tRNA pseudouridine38-40 synthase
MTTFRITLAYDGANFVGWQRQASGESIQGLVEGALAKLEGHQVDVAGAGRTDAGVHALGQVASFSLEREIDAATIVRALNAHLPETIRVVDAAAAPSDFHARFSARGKTYRYRIWNGEAMNPFERGFAWHVAGALAVDRMNEAARLLEGEHDFAVFQAAGGATSETVRRIDASRVTTEACPPFNLRVHRGSALICYEITGDGFLRHMVRAIVGTLVDIGRGRREVSWMRHVVEARDRTDLSPTAPPHGLFLVSVSYVL